MNKVQRIIYGLQIFLKYGGQDCAAEHDVFYSGPDNTATISATDLAKLDELGWSDGEYGWEIFT